MAPKLCKSITHVPRGTSVLQFMEGFLFDILVFDRKESSVEGDLAFWTTRYRKVLFGQSCCHRGEQFNLLLHLLL